MKGTMEKISKEIRVERSNVDMNKGAMEQGTRKQPAVEGCQEIFSESPGCFSAAEPATGTSDILDFLTP